MKRAIEGTPRDRNPAEPFPRHHEIDSLKASMIFAVVILPRGRGRRDHFRGRQSGLDHRHR